MTPAQIIEQATADGVNLTLSDTGTIKATGSQATINRWLPAIREHKPGIIKALQAANDTPATEEIRRIVPLVCQCTPEEIAEALQAALGDVEAALVSYRDMMSRITSLEGD